jgi:hypothetical protein
LTALPTDLIHSGNLTVNEINRAGFLINSFDLPGIGIFMHRARRIFPAGRVSRSAHFYIYLSGD